MKSLFSSENSTPTDVASVLLVDYREDNPHILESQRTGSERFTLPVGKLELGESREKCAIRELEEETGIIIADPEFLIEAHATVPAISVKGVDVKFHAFFAFFDEATNGQQPAILEPEKQNEWKWVPVSSLVKMATRGVFPSAGLGEWWIEILDELLDTRNMPTLLELHLYQLAGNSSRADVGRHKP